jgi:hypothetical protein
MCIFTTEKVRIKSEETMAKFKGGAGGVLTGMVGNVVVVTSKSGKVYLRSAPKKRSKNGWSDQQKQNWSRFSAVSSFWKKFAGSPVQEIWKVAEEGKRGINLFINANASAFGTNGELLDLQRVHLSAGKLPLPHKLSAERSSDDPSKVEVTWQYDDGKGLDRSDDILMLMTTQNGEFTGPVSSGVMRRKKSAILDIPKDVNGIYLSFASEKRKLYSEDMFFPPVK